MTEPDVIRSMLIYSYQKRQILRLICVKAIIVSLYVTIIFSRNFSTLDEKFNSLKTTKESLDITVKENET